MPKPRSVANVAAWGFVVLTAWRILLRDDRRRALAAYTVAGFCWYGLLVAAGCRTILIDRGYRERAPEHAPDFRTESLSGAAEWILGA